MLAPPSVSSPSYLGLSVDKDMLVGGVPLRHNQMTFANDGSRNSVVAITRRGGLREQPLKPKGTGAGPNPWLTPPPAH